MCSLTFFVILFLIKNATGGDMLSSAMHQSAKILKQSKTGQLILECSCPEQHECVTEMTQQVEGCFDECFPLVTTGKIHVKSPEALKQCFKNKYSVAKSLIDCVETSLKSCVKTKGKKIEYTDYNRFLDKSETAFYKQVNLILKTLGKKKDGVIEVSFDVGSCMKKCFQMKNANGYCYDRKSCQPLIDTKVFAVGFKKCLKTIDWKKHVSDLCSCTLKAGVTEMEQYCSMLGATSS